MQPRKYLQKFAAAVTKRCGICQATVEQVLPAVFDEIRQQLAENRFPCVPIEGFGTFAVIDVPERQHLYTYKGKNEMKTLPATKRLKFRAAKNLRREVIDERRFDPTRKSFSRHPQDPPVPMRNKMLYQPNKHGMNKGATTYAQPDDDDDDGLA